MKYRSKLRTLQNNKAHFESMITCYVIDDELHAIETLCDIILKVPGLELVGHTTNPLVGLDFITSNKAPDITFVDINMPQLSGIELAALVNMHTTVIFTTAYSDFALEAFEKQAFDYLLKPITQERFLRCIAKYKKQTNKNNVPQQQEYFYVKGEVKGKMIRITTADIVYIEAALNYIVIHTTDGKHTLTYLTLAELQNALPDSFCRIHRGHIINTDKIKTTGGDIVLLDDDAATELTVGYLYKSAFLKILNKRLVKTKRRI